MNAIVGPRPALAHHALDQLSCAESLSVMWENIFWKGLILTPGPEAALLAPKSPGFFQLC